MSSVHLRPRSLLALVALGAIAMGCGRSPAMPRTPVQMVRVENGAPPPAVVADDDDDDDDLTSPAGLKKSKPVQYVHMSEWQPPPSAQRIETEVVARGDSTPNYTTFPELKLHKPVGDTRVWGSFRSRRFR